MARVNEILAQKVVDLLTVTPDMTVIEAAEQMNAKGTGSVLVLEAGHLVGIFTERDLMRRVVAVRLDPAATSIRQVMTTALVTANPEASVGDCGTLMSERRIRHLPVVRGDQILGVITTGDLLAWELKEQKSVIEQLESFVFYVRQ